MLQGAPDWKLVDVQDPALTLLHVPYQGLAETRLLTEGLHVALSHVCHVDMACLLSCVFRGLTS